MGGPKMYSYDDDDDHCDRKNKKDKKSKSKKKDERNEFADILCDPNVVGEVDKLASKMRTFSCDPNIMKEKYMAPSTVEVCQQTTRMKHVYLKKKGYDPLAKPEGSEIASPKIMTMMGLGNRHGDLAKAWLFSLGVWSGLFWVSVGYFLINHYSVEGCRRGLSDAEKK